VSRDRGGDYAAAAKKGAPQAQQIADRFHLLKNLRERLKELMDRKQSCLPEVEEHASDAIEASAQGIRGRSIHEPPEPQAESEPEKHYRTIPPIPVSTTCWGELPRISEASTTGQAHGSL